MKAEHTPTPWASVEEARPFDAHDTRDIPGYNLLKQAWDRPLPHEDPLADEERRLLSVAQCVRDYCDAAYMTKAEALLKGLILAQTILQAFADSPYINDRLQGILAKELKRIEEALAEWRSP